MRIIGSILIWTIFLFIAFLSENWHLDFKSVSFLWVEEMWTNDFSDFWNWIKKFVLIPDIINSYISSGLKDLFNFFKLTENQTKYLTTFIFYFLFSFLVKFIASKYSYEKHRDYIVYWTIFLYILIISFI